MWLNRYRLLMSVLVGMLALVPLFLLRQVPRSRLDFWAVYPIVLFLYPPCVRTLATTAFSGQTWTFHWAVYKVALFLSSLFVRTRNTTAFSGQSRTLHLHSASVKRCLFCSLGGTTGRGIGSRTRNFFFSGRQ